MARKVITHLVFEGIQIKSLKAFKKFAKSVETIEETVGVHCVEITLKDIFFCPWIDTRKCQDTHTERLLLGLVERLGK